MGHHYVPQRYLRNFEDSARPRLVWLHDKRGGEPRQVAIKHILQEKEFFSQEMERFLATSVESPANKVIEKLTRSRVVDRRIMGAEYISHADRLALAVYIGAMIRRVPYYRRWAIERLPEAITKTANDYRAEIEAESSVSSFDPGLAAHLRAAVDRFEEESRRGLTPELSRVINDPIPSERIAGALFGMTWRVLISTGPQYFVTTDNPAFFFRWEGFGLGNAQSELSIPLSSTHALHGSWQGPRNGLLYIGAVQRVVREINRRLASQAERFAVYCKPAPWLLGILTKKDLYLSRIGW